MVGSVFSIADESRPPSLLAALAALTGDPPIDKRAYFKAHGINATTKGNSLKAVAQEQKSSVRTYSADEKHQEQLELLAGALSDASKRLHVPALIETEFFAHEEVSS